MLIAGFAAVFSVVFRIKAPPLGNGDGSSYAAFLFTGLVTWNLFSSLLNLSMTQLKSNGELLKKVQFPAWAPILGASIVQLVQVLLELVVLILMFLFLRNIGWTWILALPILIGTMLYGRWGQAALLAVGLVVVVRVSGASIASPDQSGSAATAQPVAALISRATSRSATSSS